MADLSTPLSSNFTLGEFLRSNTAERDDALKAEQYNPPNSIVENLTHLVEACLQPIREKFGYPIRINSGYRSPLLNKLVGGSATSQHCRGEAADLDLSPRFLTSAKAAGIRKEIQDKVKEITGKPLRPDVSENFYLFAYICIHLDDLDVDKVIHEYGTGFGHPAWVHVSASRRQDKRMILAIGKHTNKRYLKPSVKEALEYGT